MKISEMPVAKGAECMAKLTTLFDRIAQNPEIQKKTKEAVQNKKMTSTFFVDCCIFLMGNGNKDIYSAFAVLEGKTVKELESLTFGEAVNMIQRNTDGMLIYFFMRALNIPPEK